MEYAAMLPSALLSRRFAWELILVFAPPVEEVRAPTDRSIDRPRTPPSRSAPPVEEVHARRPADRPIDASPVEASRQVVELEALAGRHVVVDSSSDESDSYSASARSSGGSGFAPASLVTSEDGLPPAAIDGMRAGLSLAHRAEAAVAASAPDDTAAAAAAAAFPALRPHQAPPVEAAASPPPFVPMAALRPAVEAAASPPFVPTFVPPTAKTCPPLPSSPSFRRQLARAHSLRRAVEAARSPFVPKAAATSEPPESLTAATAADSAVPVGRPRKRCTTKRAGT